MTEQAQLKIVFAGSVGAGKSTSILAISDTEIIGTEEAASDEISLMKETTTVALDYGQLNLDDGSVVHLYGTPGQKRFDFMWDILAQGAIGVVVLIDDACEHPLEEIKTYMDGFSAHLTEQSMVVGITRTDLNKGLSIVEYRDFIDQYDPLMPVFTLDTRDEVQVTTMVKALLCRADPWLN